MVNVFNLSSSGSFEKTISYLNRLNSNEPFSILERYGRMGADILSSATPRETGETAQDWGYTVTHTPYSHVLSWHNTHVEDGVNIAVILQYGHGTGTGGYVQGIDYINPALRPLFDQIVADIWKQVTSG